MPGITAGKAFDAEPGALEYAVFSHGIACIMGTTWDKATGRRTKRTNQILVTMYQLDQDSAHRVSTRLNSLLKPSLCDSWSICAARRTITTRSKPLFAMLC